MEKRRQRNRKNAFWFSSNDIVVFVNLRSVLISCTVYTNARAVGEHTKKTCRVISARRVTTMTMTKPISSLPEGWNATWRWHNEQLVLQMDITHGRDDDRLKQMARPFPIGRPNSFNLVDQVASVSAHASSNIYFSCTCRSFFLWNGVWFLQIAG